LFRPALESLEERRLLTVPAFPGAVGFGAAATGGRGGTVYHVTNLNDSGTGSFRDAVSHTSRTIVFDVGGTIQLNSAVSVASNLTIAGQTAPGDGIALIGREVSFSNSSNDIVRYLRFRQGTLDPDADKSSINLANASNMIFDHVSIEFGQWDNLDAVGARNITIQDSIIANPIGQQFNAHVETGPITFYQDLFASAHNRSPLVKTNTQFINNVVYNFQAGYTVANTSGHFSHDIINNYFITGPSTTNPADAFYQMNTNQSVYASGNLEDSNRDGVLNGSSVTPGGVTHLSSAWSSTTASIPTMSAAGAYAYVVANAGVSLHRDRVDAQVVADLTSLGHSGRLWTSQTQTGLPNSGYGTLNGGPTLPDSDGDGMPDGWEVYYGLDPTHNNATSDFDGTGYTNIEKYVNGLADGSYGWAPPPWQVGDVGGVAVAGSVQATGGSGFIVSGSGSGTGGTSDQFTFVAQPFSLNGTLTAQVLSQTNTNGRAEAGVMFRSSMDPGAAFAEADVTPDGHIFFQYRASDGGSTSFAVAYASAPVWVRLTRAGGTFTASYSTDGATWTVVGSHTVNLGAAPLAGLVVSSHDNTTLGTATFANVSVLPAGVTDQDIGSPAVHGSASFDQTDGAFTVAGGGADIYGSADAFHLAWVNFTGAASVIAEVTSQTNTNAGAKAGVMFRNSTDPSAGFADVVVTPGQGVKFESRDGDGGTLASTAVTGLAAPVWVQLTQLGTTFTASYSTDGLSWTPIGLPRTVHLSDSALLGLAVTAHNNALLSTATFAGVALHRGAQVDLSSSFNATGIVADGTPFTGGLDGNGNAYSANLLGTSLNLGGHVVFNLGAAGGNDVVQAAGQTIALPQGQFSTLTFLGTAVNGAQPGQTFTVTYTDGSSDTFTQDLSDWQNPQGFAGEAVAAALPYEDAADGSSPATANYLYHYSFLLNPQKTVSSITLPGNGNVVLLAIDLLS
jgi:hypothetical protein